MSRSAVRCPSVSLNGSRARARLRSCVGDGDDVRLAHRGVLPAAQRQAGLVDEEILEDQPALGRRDEAR